jgi:glycosyltransferase involved in cell wall biosynthesis
VKILVAVTRFPWPNTKGDQMRAWAWVTELARRHEVTVVTAAAPADERWRTELERHARVVTIPTGPAGRLAAAAGCLVRGQPGQVGWMTPERAWRAVRAQSATHDVLLAMTVRSLRARPGIPCVVDHVDALSLNMRRRAGGPEHLVVRAAARFEAALLRRWERRVAAWATGQIVTSSEEAAYLPAPPTVEVIPISTDAEVFVEPPGHRRDIDVVLSGNMRYPPNRAAAVRMANDIVPKLQEVRPVRAVIVGRAASTLGVQGVEVHSDVDSVSSYLRRARVAVAPLEGGTGMPNKVLEAAAAGAALVTVPWAAERFGIAAATATTAEEFAHQIVELLDDEPRRRALVASAADVVRDHLTPTLAARVESALHEAQRSARGPGRERSTPRS